MRRNVTRITLLILASIILYTLGIYNDELCKLVYTVNSLLGFTYVSFMIFIAILMKYKEKINSLRYRNDALENLKYNFQDKDEKRIDRIIKLEKENVSLSHLNGHLERRINELLNKQNKSKK